jgi:hypothetical protein
MELEGILDKEEIRCKNTLKLLGYWFEVDGIKYFIKY